MYIESYRQQPTAHSHTTVSKSKAMTKIKTQRNEIFQQWHMHETKMNMKEGPMVECFPKSLTLKLKI